MSTVSIAELFTTDEHNPSFAEVCQAMPTKCKPIDFCVPVNRHFPHDALLEEIRTELPDIVKYYPDYAVTHQQALSDFTGLPVECIVAANGSTELITQLCQSAQGPFATDIPTFGRWTDLLLQRSSPTHFLKREEENNFELSTVDIIKHVRNHGIRTLVLCNPNNPTGVALTEEDVFELVQSLADLDLIVIDESFIDFSDVKSIANLALRTPNVVVIKSLGKSLGWHGVRIGYAVAEPETAKRLRALTPYWNVNGLAAFVLSSIATMRNVFDQSLIRVRADRKAFVQGLTSIEQLKVYPSHTNFVFIKLPDSVDGRELRDTLLTEKNLLIRACGNKIGSSDQYMRLAVNLPRENVSLIAPLQDHLQQLNHIRHAWLV